MKIRSLILSLICILAFSCSRSAEPEWVGDPVDYVNPLIGTLTKYEISNGNVFPVIAMPWGMNFWTAQTGRMGDGWIYSYNEDKIRGFRQTHQPHVWLRDYGQFAIMPVTKGPVFDEDARASWYSHKVEKAKPYYYSAYLAEYDVVTEMAPTERAVKFRMTYPERDMSYLVIDGFDEGSYVKVIPEENLIVGYTTKNAGSVTDNFCNWFVIESDTPFEYVKGVKDGVFTDAMEVKADHAGAVVGFRTSKGQQVHFNVASSFISLEQAKLNLNEVKDKSFDAVCQAGRDRWNEVLGRIQVSDEDLDNVKTFYSCLYRSLIFPHDISEIDADGNRVHYSPHDGDVHKGHMYVDTGFWDTFRSLFPLLNLLYPEENVKMQEGLVNTYKESGYLTEWSAPGHRDCMIGQNSASVVADAYLRGLEGYDVEALWDAVVKGANSRHPECFSSGRAGWEEYNTLGYVPSDAGVWASTARTLEYAYNDWCIYQLGKALGKAEEEIAVYAQRALNYRNVYSDEVSLMRGRKADGSFDTPFHEQQWGGAFVEGNALHYTWSVFHDPAGLIKLMGSDAKFSAQMDRVFDTAPITDPALYGGVAHEVQEMQIAHMGNYAHGNQPAQHMIYLYDWCGQPWKAQARVRETMDKLYSWYPDGYCGDEDNGQTSAWYVFSALGFYPVCPGTGEYALGSPLFKHARLNLSNGRTVTLNAPENSEENVYISSMAIDGKTWTKNYLIHDSLMKGLDIDFVMSSEPDTSRGVSKEDRPYSFSEHTNTCN